MPGSRRIAVFGGTFDPVHNGHLTVARKILKLFALDKVVFMPAYVPPHKRGVKVSPALHRYAMLALATQDDRRLRVSTAELDAPEKPYTVETAARLQERYGEKTRLFFVMGADSWSEIASWRDWERLLTLCDHIVVTRPGYEPRTEQAAIAAASVIDVRGLRDEEIAAQVNSDSGPRVFITDAVMVDVSATAARAAARAADHDQLCKLVPQPVTDYIEKYELYRKGE